MASEKIKEFSNSKDAERISNKLVQVISLISDTEKPEIIACLFASRVNQNLSTLEFLRAVDIVQSTFIEDIVGFIHLNQVVDCTFEDLEQYRIENLVNTALIHQDYVDNQELIRSGREDEIGISKYTQSDFGYKFRQACHSGAIQRRKKA